MDLAAFDLARDPGECVSEILSPLSANLRWAPELIFKGVQPSPEVAEMCLGARWDICHQPNVRVGPPLLGLVEVLPRVLPSRTDGTSGQIPAVVSRWLGLENPHAASGAVPAPQHAPGPDGVRRSHASDFSGLWKGLLSVAIIRLSVGIAGMSAEGPAGVARSRRELAGVEQRQVRLPAAHLGPGVC